MALQAQIEWLKGITRNLLEILQAAVQPGRMLCAVATITFPLAVVTPFFTFAPSFGDPLVDDLFEYAQPGSMAPKTSSVLGGIALLFGDGTIGDAVIAIVLLLFSVFFPAVKLTLLWGVLLWPDKISRRVTRDLEMLGPWSMADVFVVSVLLLAFKSFPGGTTFTTGVGYYLFLISVVTGLLATLVARGRYPATA